MSVRTRASRGTRHPPAWSPATASRTASRSASAACRSTPPDPMTWAMSASGRGLAPGPEGLAWRRTATVAARRASSRSRACSASRAGGGPARGPHARHTPAGPLRRRGPRGPRPRPRPRRSSASPGRPRRCGPATAGPPRPWRVRHPRPAAAGPSRRRWWRPHVDDEHVAVGGVGQHLHAPQHDIRGGRLHHLHELAAAREVLATDDVVEERGPDGGAGALGRDDADLRKDVVGDLEAAACRGQQLGDLLRRVGVARHHDRRGDPHAGEALGVVQQHVGVAAVGAADEQDDVGPGGAQRVHVLPDSRPEATWTTLAPALSPTR